MGTQNYEGILQRPDNGRMLAAKMAKPQQVGVPASEASALIGLLSAIYAFSKITFEQLLQILSWYQNILPIKCLW